MSGGRRKGPFRLEDFLFLMHFSYYRQWKVSRVLPLFCKTLLILLINSLESGEKGDENSCHHCTQLVFPVFWHQGAELFEEKEELLAFSIHDIFRRTLSVSFFPGF